MKLPGKWYVGDRAFLRVTIERIQFANAMGTVVHQHRYKDADTPTRFWLRRNALHFVDMLNRYDEQIERLERERRQG